MLVAAREAAHVEDAEIEAILAEEEDLEALSHSVAELIKAGKLDEAEQVAPELIECYPEIHDGFDRLGMFYEAGEQLREAADCYRRVIEFVREHPEGYEPGFETAFQ